jgi:hypothetical protein
MDRLQQRFDLWIRIILGALLVVLILLCTLLFHEYQALRQADMISARALWLHSRAPATASSVDSIQSWMTYDYINHIYGLPPGYLQSTLNIADTRYPRVSISESSEAQKVTAAELTIEVKSAVSDYMAKNENAT